MKKEQKGYQNMKLMTKGMLLIELLLLLVLCVSLYKKHTTTSVMVKSEEIEEKSPCVVIDAGHGGMDPGKIGIHQELEKNINLQIAKKVQQYLEQEDIQVVMTRETDEGLYQESDHNKKIVDMKKRLEVIEESKPDLAISIHQNSYSSEEVTGMQVFYYKDSLEGKHAADMMQKQLIETLQPQKRREAKDNKTYYLLKKTTVPLMIIECGFLSNAKESKMLSDEVYQKRLAWAIHLGILKYLNQTQ